MAGDWIKMRTNLAVDPAVIAMAERLRIDEFAVVGRLHAFWSWIDQQSRDGHATGVTHSWLDRYVRSEGFAAALVAVGWLAAAESGLTVPNFDRHNGETAKARALTTNRQRKHRADSVTPESRHDRDEGVTREEKRREEEKKDSLSGSEANADGIAFDEDITAATAEYNTLAAEWSKPKITPHRMRQIAPKLVKARHSIQREYAEFSMAEAVRRTREQREFFLDWTAWDLEWFSGTKKGRYNAEKVWNRMYAQGQSRSSAKKDAPRKPVEFSDVTKRLLERGK